MHYQKYDISSKSVQYLIQTDELLSRLIRYIGSCELAIEEDGFKCMVKYIVGQQISDKARETIWKRLCSALGDISPSTVLSSDTDFLRHQGLSGRKVEYITALAKRVVAGEIDFASFQNLNNDTIIAQLISQKGIGQWTAEMYLIFSLGREDVLSRGDGTIKRTIQWMYSLDHLPTPAELTAIFNPWKQYSSIVSAYLWKAIALDLTRRSFNQVIP